MHVLDREERWFEREVNEAIYLKLEQPSLNKGGGLRHQLSATCNAVNLTIVHTLAQVKQRLT